MGDVGPEVAVVVEFKGDGECRLALGFAQVRHLADLFFEPGAEVGAAAEVEFEVGVFFLVGLVVFPVVVVVFFPGAVVFEFAGEVVEQAGFGFVVAVFVFAFALAAALLLVVVFALQMMFWLSMALISVCRSRLFMLSSLIACWSCGVRVRLCLRLRSRLWFCCMVLMPVS